MVNLPLTRTASLTEKTGRQRKIELSSRRRFYFDHNTGQLKAIDTNPRDSSLYGSYRFEVLEHDLHLAFAASEKQLPFLRITDPKSGGVWALWVKNFGRNSHEIITPGIVDKINNGVVWRLDDNADMTLDVLGHKIRKLITLHKRPEWNTLTIIIARGGGSLIDGLATGKPNRALVAFRKGANIFENPLFWFSKPYAWDSGEEMKQKLIEPQYSIEPLKTGVWELRISLDPDWLDEAEYPVYIDPTVVLQPDASEGYDARLLRHVPDRNYGVEEQLGMMYYSTYGGECNHTLIKFDLSEIVGPVTSATLRYWKKLAAGTCNIYTHRLLRNWGEGIHNNQNATAGECSWNHYKHPNTWTTGGAWGIGTDVTDALDGPTIVDSNDSPIDIDVTDTIEEIRTAVNNYGLMQRTPGTASINRYHPYSSDWTTAAERPKLTVVYAVSGGVYCGISPLAGSKNMIIAGG